MNLYRNSAVDIQEIMIEDIPCLLFSPPSPKNAPTIILYHGWSSRKELQAGRGFFLSAAGYTVLIPDALHHGKRGTLDYSTQDTIDYFWDVVITNIEEYPVLYNYMTQTLQKNPKTFGVIGNSMGGITVSGLLTTINALQTGVVLNGTCDFSAFNQDFLDQLDLQNKEEMLQQNNEKISPYDPMKQIESWKGKNVLLLHGEKDSVVSLAPQINFYNIYKKSPDFSLSLQVYDRVDHVVTTNMMEESLRFLNRYFYA